MFMTEEQHNVIMELDPYVHATSDDGQSSFDEVSNLRTAVEKFNNEKYGALRDGGEVSLLSNEYIGILISTIHSSFVYCMLWYVIRPVLSSFWNVPAENIYFAVAFFIVPMVLSVIFGLLSDAWPIFGYRRKTYMILGAFLSALSLCCVTIIMQSIDVETLQSDEKKSYQWYTDALFLIAVIGTAITKVATEALVVELSQQEALRKRGNLQVNYLLARCFFDALALWIRYFVLTYNDDRTKLRSESRISLVNLFWVVVICSLLSLPFIHWNIAEVTVQQRENDNINSLIAAEIPTSPRRVGLLATFNNFIVMCQQRCVWQFILFVGIYTASSWFSFGHADSQLIRLLPVISMPEAMSIMYEYDGYTSIITLITLWIWKKYLQNSSWRTAFRFNIMVAVGEDVVRALVMLFIPSARTAFVYFGMGAFAHGIVKGLIFIYFFMPISEIVSDGCEGITVGIISSIQVAVGAVMYRLSAELNLADFSKMTSTDTGSFISTVFLVLMASYSVNALAYLTVPLLARQKIEVQQLRIHSGRNPVASGLILVLLLLAMIYSLYKSIQAFCIGNIPAPNWIMD